MPIEPNAPRTPLASVASFATPSALARRDAYDAMMGRATNVAQIVALHRERETDAQRKMREFITRQNTYAPPKRNVDRRDRPNDWERDAPLNVHKRADPSCHHPLVNCAHKW